MIFTEVAMALKGDRVRQLREAKGYSRETLAELVGVGTVQVWRWEKGENDPTANFIERLARILGTTSDYLIGLEDHPLDRHIERDLSPDEIRLVEAYRTGRLWEIIALLNNHAPPDVQSEKKFDRG